MKQLDPRSIWIFFSRYLIAWLFFVAFASIFLTAFNALSWLRIIIPLVVVFSYVWARMSYQFYRYELTDQGFKKECGVIYKKYVTIPYSRIQNVDIYRGILVRLLGLSNIHIQTAGMSSVVGYGLYGLLGASAASAEGRLPGISREEAEALREELVRRSNRPLTQQGI